MIYKINKLYKFATLAPSILGASYTMMKLKALLSADEAIKNNFDPHNMNKKLLGMIGGLPSNANDLTYLLFENTDGKELLIAAEWIDETSVTIVERTNIMITIPDKDTDDLIIIKRALLDLGYKDLDVISY